MAEQETLEGFSGSDASVGVTGAIRIADVDSPTVAGVGKYDPLIQKNLGYISDDGVEEGRDEDKQEWIPWQENAPIRSEFTKSVVTLKFVLWQSNKLTTGFYYGVSEGDIRANEDGSYEFDEDGKPDMAFNKVYLDVIDKGRIRRTILANAQVTARGSITYKTDTMIGYEVTVTAYPGPQGWSVRRVFFGYSGFDADGDSEPILKTLVLDDGITAGTGKFAIGASESSALTLATLTAAQIKTAIAGLPGVGSTNVQVQGTIADGFDIVLDGDIEGVEALTFTTTGVTPAGKVAELE